MYGSYDQVQMLLQRDANVGIPDGEGKTPLHWAINSKHQHSCSIVQSLVEHMPSVVNWQDHDGRTSLHLAVAEGSYNLVKTLVSWSLSNGSKLHTENIGKKMNLNYYYCCFAYFSNWDWELSQRLNRGIENWSNLQIFWRCYQMWTRTARIKLHSCISVCLLCCCCCCCCCL